LLEKSAPENLPSMSTPVYPRMLLYCTRNNGIMARPQAIGCPVMMEDPASVADLDSRLPQGVLLGNEIVGKRNRGKKSSAV
jgi:hypothetical protein